jgi:hypothetical protein
MPAEFIDFSAKTLRSSTLVGITYPFGKSARHPPTPKIRGFLIRRPERVQVVPTPFLRNYVARARRKPPEVPDFSRVSKCVAAFASSRGAPP